MNFIRSLPGDIIAVQELWNHLKEIEQTGAILGVTRRQDKRGGGTATVSTLTDQIKVLNKVQINKDSHALKIKHQNTYYWIANVYLNKGTPGKV